MLVLNIDECLIMLLCWVAGLQLRLLTFNRQMRIFGTMEMALQWDYGGSINAQMQIGAVPVVADGASVRSLPGPSLLTCRNLCVKLNTACGPAWST